MFHCATPLVETREPILNVSVSKIQSFARKWPLKRGARPQTPILRLSSLVFCLEASVGYSEVIFIK